MSRSKPRPRPDFTWANHGAVWLLHPTTPAAEAHLRACLSPNPEVQWFVGSVVVEPRYVVAMTEALEADGYAF